MSFPCHLLAAALVVGVVTGCDGTPRTPPTAPSAPASTATGGAAPPVGSAPAQPAPHAPTPPQAPPTPSTSSPQAPPSTATVDGTWSSARCGERTYERVITLHDGELSVQDRVSPCPPKAQCVWSGIVERRGRYRVDGARLWLDVPDDGRRTAGTPLPAQMALEPGPVEPSGAGGPTAGCRYVRESVP